MPIVNPKETRLRLHDDAEEVITTGNREELNHGWAISVHNAHRPAVIRVIPLKAA